ncbi:MAG TPA: hypothetical protein VN442_04720 [Bryobacteraceae bacterium]|nr:hypothetical protein [Bryobacteraceae bacterium]
MATGTTITVRTPGKDRVIACQDHGTHYVLPDGRRVDVGFLHAALRTSPGRRCRVTSMYSQATAPRIASRNGLSPPRRG